jgi:SSS family solute:Na+ symporter
MSLSTLDYAIIIVYFAGLALYGVLVRRIRGFGDYSVARRRVPTSMIAASLCATYIGPGYSLGLAGRAFTSAYLFPLLFLGFSLQTVLVGLFVAPRLTRYQEAHSVGDVMGKLYGREAQVLTGVISAGLCAGFAAVMARAGGQVLAGVLGLPLWAGVCLVTLVGITYTYTGGLKSVIATEALQFVVKVTAVSAMVLAARSLVASGNQLGDAALETTWKALSTMKPLTLLGLVLSFFLGETLIPPYANRALAARTESSSRRGFVLAGLFSIVWFAMIGAIGIIGSRLLPASTPEDRAFVAVAAKALPSGLFGLLVAAIAAIVMSSQESVLNAGAVAVTRDMIGTLRNLSDHGSLVLSRLLTLTLGLVSVFMALRAPSIIDGLLICYSLWAPSVLLPLVWGVMGLPTRRSTGLAAIVGGTVGSSLALLGHVAGGDTPTALVIGLASAALAAGLAAVVTRQRRSA